jgi:hypothetical protein
VRVSPKGRGGLRDLPARAIVAAIADAAARWTDADFAPRVRATRAIMARTGYTEPVVDFALDHLFGAVTKAAIEGCIATELGSLGALDGFIARAGRPDAFARGVERVAVVASDTTIGVALPPAILALCAKCRVAIRDRGDGLCSAFRDTLTEERPEFGESLATHAPLAHDDPAWMRELSTADAVVAFGADDALREIRAHVRAEARFVAFGHRTSVGYVAREALRDESGAARIAEHAARDALLYDGEGCLSLHALFVESGGAVTPERFGAILATAVDRVAVEFPAGLRAVPASVVAYRNAALFRAALGRGAVFSSAGTPHLTVVEPPRDEPPPLLPRVLAVYAVQEPAEMLAFVRRHALPLEAVGVARLAGRDDLVEAVVGTGAARIARLGELQSPRLGVDHGGVARVAPFVRWIAREA